VLSLTFYCSQSAGSRRLRHVASAVILVVVSSVAKECDQLAVYEPFERNGVAEWEKMEIDFCILSETYGMCLMEFRRTVCCIVIDAVDTSIQ